MAEILCFLCKYLICLLLWPCVEINRLTYLLSHRDAVCLRNLNKTYTAPKRNGRNMSDALQRYRALEEDLIYIRWQYAGLESEEEEPILDAMEEIWYELSEEEQNELNSEGTKSLIRDDAKSSVSERRWTDGNIWDNSNSGELKVVA